MNDLAWLAPDNHTFPPTCSALDDPNGLLAVGGDLSWERLVSAYSKGIFPWYDDTQPILWWTPDPRMVVVPSDIYFNRSFRKLANKKLFRVTTNTHFAEVIEQCANVDNRIGEDAGTWITDDMLEAYRLLHHKGYAHSVEVWQGEELVGGLYGVSIGAIFFGESMFSRVSGASKVGFATLSIQLQQWGFKAIDCQVATDYLASFGAKEINREQFERILKDAHCEKYAKMPQINWKTDWVMPTYGIAFVNGELDLG